jgi:hypothetical protein
VKSSLTQTLSEAPAPPLARAAIAAEPELAQLMSAVELDDLLRRRLRDLRFELEVSARSAADVNT